MKIPDGYTEEQVLDVIMRIARRLAPRYRFGCYDIDDIIQEAAIIGMEGMERYDSGRPLENFLSIHISNRLKSFKRDNFVRQEPPQGSEQWEDWNRRYSSKKNLIEPLTIDNIRDENEKNMWSKIDFIDDLEMKEMYNIIDAELPMELRADYLRMKQGASVPKPRRDKIERAVVDILEKAGYETG